MFVLSQKGSVCESPKVINKQQMCHKPADVLRSCFAEWQRLCESYGRYLTVSQAQSLHDMGKCALSFYNGAAWEAAGQNKLAWQIIPKAHVHHHMQIDLLREKYNPRFFHNFQGEDMMKSLKQLVITALGTGMERRVLKRAILRISASTPQDLAARKS